MYPLSPALAFSILPTTAVLLCPGSLRLTLPRSLTSYASKPSIVFQFSVVKDRYLLLTAYQSSGLLVNPFVYDHSITCLIELGSYVVL